ERAVAAGPVPAALAGVGKRKGKGHGTGRGSCRPHPADLEALTLRHGRAIFSHLERSTRVPFTPAWWDERLMEWSMGDESIKVQLFRFVDVLPLLHTPDSIARHLREYFGQAEEHLPGWLKLGLKLIPTRGPLGRLFAWVARRSAMRLARKFIAGSDLDEALANVGDMRRRSLAFTVDLLGEATITETEAEESEADYVGIIRGL